MELNDWEEHKSTIVLLYSIEREPLRKIVSYMREHHNFDKKVNQYEYRLKKWGVKKNAPKEVWSYVAHQIRKKKKKGKKSKVMLYNVPVPEARVCREIQRYTNIPTAAEFGMDLPSPKTPEGGIVHVQSPSILEFDLVWPDTLPWFQFEHNLFTLLQQPSGLLNAFLAAFGSDTRARQYPEHERLSPRLSISRDPLMLRKAVSHHCNLISKNHQDSNQQTEALVPSGNSYSLAIDMLKVIFFCLSNCLTNKILGLDGVELCDRFLLQLFEALSHSNLEILSSLLSDRCRTASMIKEALYKSAIREKSYVVVSRLLESGVDPNMPVELRGKVEMDLRFEPWNFRGIDIAATRADIRLGEILLRAGANVNTSDGNDIPPLALIGLDWNKANFDDALEVNPPTASCHHGETKTFSPLELAIARHDGANKTLYTSSPIGLQLRPFGARCSPLLIAIVAEHDLIITSCLAGDAATMSRLLNGITPLVATAWNPDLHIAEMLLMSGAKISPKQSDSDSDGQISVPTPIHVASFHGNTELVRVLVNRGSSCNLHYTRLGGNKDHFINWLLPPGISSPCHLALRSKNIETASLLLPHSKLLGDKTIISELISRGADILFADTDGTTALEAAMENGDAEMLSSFFASGTELAVESKDDCVVRHFEASCLVLALLEREWDLAEYLLSSFVPGPSQSFYLPDADHGGEGITPLWAAYLSGNVHITEAMVRRGYSLEKGDRESFSTSIVYGSKQAESIQALFWSTCHILLLSAIKSCDIQRTRECTMFVDSLDFTFGRSNRHSDETPLGLPLINAGADTEYTPGRQSPLQLAASLGYVEMAKPAHFNYGATALQILVEHGADVDAPPAKKDGRTALEGAAEHGRLDMVEFLLEMGARLTGEMRIYYVRSVGFAMSGEYGSWTENDQLLYDRRESNNWHVRWIVGSSETASEEVEETMWYGLNRVAEDWLRSAAIASDEFAGLDVFQEEEANSRPVSPWRAGDGVNHPLQPNNEDEEITPVQLVESNCKPLLRRGEYDAESERTPEHSRRAVDEQVASTSLGYILWEDPFWGADQPNDVWDI
ncbi:ankyrin repeat-containing domain protein [Xylaria sp. FL1777]|nr:ankyrin repeat-containing domain protein [Xylaria sp. FL1777]